MTSPIDDLELFVVVVRCRSFTRAARELGLTRSAVSKRLSRLEARLGVALLHRTTRTMVPTDTGARLAQGAADPLARLRRLEEEIGSAGHAMRGAVRLAVPLAFGLRAVAPVLHDFARSHPEVVLEVSYDDRWVDLGQAGVDLAIRGGVLADSSLLARRLRPLQISLAASPDYLMGHPPIADPEALRAHRFVTPTRAPLHLVHADGRSVVLHPDVALIADNADARADAARMGLGIALLPDFVALDGLEAVLADWVPGGDRRRSFYLLRPPGGPVPRAVAAVSEHLVAALGSSRVP